MKWKIYGIFPKNGSKVEKEGMKVKQNEKIVGLTQVLIQLQQNISPKS